MISCSEPAGAIGGYWGWRTETRDRRTDGEGQRSEIAGSEWKSSDPSFTEANDEFVADKIQHRSRIKRDLNVGGAVFVTTSDQQQIYSTPVALGIYEPKDGKFLVVGEITNCSRLRQQTTMTLAWIAQRLQMGTKTHLSHLLYWDERDKS